MIRTLLRIHHPYQDSVCAIASAALTSVKHNVLLRAVVPATLPISGRSRVGAAVGEHESGDRRTGEWDHGDERRQADRTGEGPRPGAETTACRTAGAGDLR